MYLVSEANLTKYDLLVNNITNGLAKNVECMQPANAELFLKTLSASVFSLKGDIKLYNFDQEKLQPDCTIQTMKKGLKQGHQ